MTTHPHPGQLGFFEALHVIERRNERSASLRGSEDAGPDLVSLRPRLSLDFPVRDLHSVDLLPPDAGGARRWRIDATFLGLYGTESPLPTHYTASLLEDELDDGLSPVRSFFDVFNARLFTLLYGAWRKYRYHVGVSLDRARPDSLSRHLLSLIGYGTPGLAERAGIDRIVPAMRMVRYGGLLTQRPRSAAAIRSIIQDSFRSVPIRIRQCVRRTIEIPPTSRTFLGGKSDENGRRVAPPRRLGHDAVCGERIQDRTSRFRVIIGPLDHRQYRAWLPPTRRRRTLDELVRRSSSPHLSHEVELILTGMEVPPLQLARRARPRLGWTTWLGAPRGPRSLGHLPDAARAAHGGRGRALIGFERGLAMIRIDTRSLISQLNRTCTTALEAAAGHCLSERCGEVLIEHFLLKLCDAPGSDLEHVFRHFDVDEAALRRSLGRVLATVHRGHSDRPVWSRRLVEWLQTSCLVATVELGHDCVRSGTLLLALLRLADHCADATLDSLRVVPVDDLRRRFAAITAESAETPTPGRLSGTEAEALAKYTVNLTERARAGAIDPIFGRDREIRQIVDILARRRKNNPIIVGEPGVGKTALVEGLALKIARGEAAASLADARVLALDLGLLQAGAGVRGEFERRIKEVIDEIKACTAPVILFIDEAHTLIGAGNVAGGGDAANLLKPALARGELRTIAATTWSEYKKYFEKDAALSRRFNLVKVVEPDETTAIVMLRGLARTYEEEHGVRIFNDAIVACARLGNRYVAGRQQPDKGIDLLDTAAARVKLSHTARPIAIDEQQARLDMLASELDALRRDIADGAPGDQQTLASLERSIDETRSEIETTEGRWNAERTIVETIVDLRRQLAETADPSAEGDRPGRIGALQCKHDERIGDLARMQGTDPLVHLDVTPDVVAEVVADWTGVPVGKLVRDEARAILNIEQKLAKRIRGQDHAVGLLAEAIRAARVGVRERRAPIGVFLCVGPSGVGKTECALGLADLLFGGERCLTTVNMSEFQERHTVSRLIGSPPGYVGYGEGGVLTEAVRKKPYSVVLLDEVEKADREVMDLFYQVFDKGTLADGEGREVDFSNSVVYLTSNLGDDVINDLCAGDTRPSADELLAAVRPVLLKHFKPALLARMTVVPFYPLEPTDLRQIAAMKLERLTQRVAAEHALPVRCDDAVADRLVSRCTERDSGARNLDYVIRTALLPVLSRRLLETMDGGPRPAGLRITAGAEAGFEVSAESGVSPQSGVDPSMAVA